MNAIRSPEGSTNEDALCVPCILCVLCWGIKTATQRYILSWCIPHCLCRTQWYPHWLYHSCRHMMTATERLPSSKITVSARWVRILPDSPFSRGEMRMLSTHLPSTSGVSSATGFLVRCVHSLGVFCIRKSNQSINRWLWFIRTLGNCLEQSLAVIFVTGFGQTEVKLIAYPVLRFLLFTIIYLHRWVLR